jgi:hypothetical protein
MAADVAAADAERKPDAPKPKAVDEKPEGAGAAGTAPAGAEPKKPETAKPAAGGQSIGERQVQAKGAGAAVGAADDPAERAADHAADKVMRMPEPVAGTDKKPDEGAATPSQAPSQGAQPGGAAAKPEGSPAEPSPAGAAPGAGAGAGAAAAQPAAGGQAGAAPKPETVKRKEEAPAADQRMPAPAPATPAASPGAASAAKPDSTTPAGPTPGAAPGAAGQGPAGQGAGAAKEPGGQGAAGQGGTPTPAAGPQAATPGGSAPVAAGATGEGGAQAGPGGKAGAETGQAAPEAEPPAPEGEQPARETPRVPKDVQEYLDASRGKGAPLPEKVRKSFEGKYQRPFDDVRIHEGGAADDASKKIDALAFTRGNDIYFRTGAYDPESAEGKRLIAHELAHVVQQRPGVNRKVGPLQRWTMPFLTTKTDSELIRDAVDHQDVAAVKEISDFSAASAKDRWAMIDLLINQGLVGPRDSSALARLWSSFGDLPKTASANMQRWKKSVSRSSGLKDLPEVKVLMELFPKDVKATASSYLFSNRQLVISEMERLDLPADDKAAVPGGTGEQVDEMRKMQEAAAAVAKDQKAQEMARNIYVGYELQNMPSMPFDVSVSGDSPSQQAPNQQSMFTPVAFDPYIKPQMESAPDTLLIPKIAAKIVPYDTVKKEWDRAAKSAQGLLQLHPALYAVSREGKSETTAAFAKLDSPQKAREQLAIAMRALFRDIEGAQVKLDAGDLDPLDLTPIHERLMAGNSGQGGSATNWHEPFAEWAARTTLENHSFNKALIALGLETAAAALFVVAPLTGGASLYVALAGLAVTAVKADMSAQNYEALAQASKTSVAPGTELVTPGQVEEAAMVKDADETALALAALAVGIAAAGEAIGAIRSAGKSQPGINTAEIRFSQSSVTGVAEIEASMRANGWQGPPIDVVRMPDGKLTAIDNTRVLAASRAGIDVQAVVHPFDEPLPTSQIERFTTKKGVPETWGDAVKLRLGKQSAAYRGLYPFGSEVTGSAE